MERPKQQRSRTLFRRMLAFLLVVLLVQMLVYVATFFGGNLLSETENNAFFILAERTANRKLDLENEMVHRWSNVEQGKMELLEAVSQVLREEALEVEALYESQALCQQVLTRSANSLVTMLRNTGVTGAFVILDAPGDDMEYPGVYIRDYDPASYSADNADLLLERGLPQVARDLSIPMDSYWSALFRFDEEDGNYNKFFQSIDAARQATAEERQKNYFYHWSTSFALSGSDRPVVVYTVPLVWPDGTVIGVIGVDITVDYLTAQLNYHELDSNRAGAYFLGVTEDGGESYTTVCANGPNFRASYGQPETIQATAHELDGIVTLPGPTKGDAAVYGAVQPIKLYNNNTPFENEQWALIGILGGEHLLSYSNRLRAVLLVSIGFSLALGLCLVFMAARSFIRPISQLMADLGRSDPNKPIRLRRVRINELDALSQSIEDLSNAAAESASRISKIIELSHIPIGVFESRKREGIVFCSKSLFAVLDWPERPEEDAYLSEKEFNLRMGAITAHHREGKDGERIFCLHCNGRERWVQLFYRDDEENALGAFIDVTDEIESKRKIEYERDFDVLTGLYNRRAFDKKVEAFLLGGETQIPMAAILMVDLDNLKYINDSYGHDYGDRYIQSFAQSLEFFRPYSGVSGRRSGDEFNVFLYGFDSEEALRRVVAAYWEHLGETGISLPDGERMRVRASGGMAWYGKDASDYNELIRLADFAMYNVKHTMKGAFWEFDQVDYDHKAILINGQDALNRMLENRLVRYALQPIVSAIDGSVYGYEFLMRPMMEQLTDLDALFRLARAQFKLQQIEEMTWQETLARFAHLIQVGKIPPGVKAFINSVGSQELSWQTIGQLEERYANIIQRVVLEITENEETQNETGKRKKAHIARWGGLLALDDYGTGYNSEALLVNISPDIVKIDISFIRKVDSDKDRLELVQSLVSYAKSRGILVLAEGVENAGELETLIACGVDYLQGFYLGYPDFEVTEPAPERSAEICRLHKQYFPDA